MTWIIADLHIQGVKGVLDRSGDFRLASKRTPHSIAIFAPNGCGKSGYADAVEYLFSEDGGVDHLGKGGADSERGGKHAIPHVLAAERGINPEVSITILETDTNERITVTRPIVMGRSDNRPSELVQILRLAPAHRLLRQHDLRRFVVDMTPGEKYSELSRWIGLTRLESILKHLETASNELGKVDLDREISERQQDVLTNTNQEITTGVEDDVLRWCHDKASDFLDPQIPIASRDELIFAVKELSKLREKKILESSASGVYQAKSFLEDELPKVFQPNGLIDASLSTLSRAIETEEIVNEIRKSVQTSMYKQTWEAAQELLVGSQIKECPICGTEWDKTVVGTQDEAIILVTVNLGKLSSLTEAENTHKEAAHALQNSIKPVADILNVVMSYLQTLDLSVYEPDLLEISNTITQLQNSSSSAVGMQQRFIEVMDCLRKLLADAYPKIQKIEIKGIPAEAQAIEQLITKFQNLLNALVRLDELERERQEYRRIQQNFNTIANVVRERSARLVNDIVNVFRADALSIYSMIHPSGAVPNIHIYPDVENRTLSLRIDFHNEGRTVPPAGYLSESYINTLGLALFIGSVGQFNRKFPFIFLDDIVSSYDADHRARIVDVIAERLVNFQVMLTTHDLRFYNMLRDRLSDQGWQFERVASWDFEHGPLRESDALRQDEIDTLIRQGNPTTAGNAVRQFMEDWLDKLCAKYEVYTIHKRGEKEFDRTLFDFWGPFIKRLEEIRGEFFQKQIASQPCYDRLRTHSLLNHYSHAQANPYEWQSMGDVVYIWSELQTFQLIFTCASCHRQLQYHHDDNRLYCTCGGQVFPNP